MKNQSELRSRKNHKPPTRKRLGELAELAFMSKAASLGFGVAKPYGDSERFDFILSRDGHLWRVQVKSTRTAKRGVYEISAHGSWGSRHLHQGRNRSHRRLRRPQEGLVHHPHRSHPRPQAPLPPPQRPPQSLLQIRKVPRGLVATAALTDRVGRTLLSAPFALRNQMKGAPHFAPSAKGGKLESQPTTVHPLNPSHQLRTRTTDRERTSSQTTTTPQISPGGVG